MAVDKEDRAGL